MSAFALKTAVLNRFRAAKAFRATYQFAGSSIDTWFDRTYRMYNGIHDPEQIVKERQRSGINLCEQAYYPFCRLKVDAARVYIDGTYSHAVEAPFVFEPTRNPQLNDAQRGEISVDIARLVSKQLAETGLDYKDIWSQASKSVKDPQVDIWLKAQVDKMSSTYNDKAKELAGEACSFRAGYIADQLDFGGWLDAWPIITHNLMAEPYTALCARESKAFTTNKWVGSKSKRVVKTAPSFRALDPRNLYLSPDSISAQDGNGVTELTLRTIADLLAMYKSDDETVCRDGLLAAINKLANVKTEVNWLGMTQAVTDQQTHSLVHQGFFSGKELALVGHTGYDDADYLNVTLEVCHGELIRLEILPYENNYRHYYTAQHTKTSSSYAGESILTKLFHVQNQLNIATLMRDRNFYMSSGPSLITHSGYFNRPQDLNIMPYSRNMAAIDRSTAGGRGIEQIEVAAHYSQQDQHIEWLKRQGDEMSGVVSGLSGLARSGITRTTLGGAVLDQTAGERMMNAAVLNLDRGMIEPMAIHLDADNMQWDEIPKHYMRGDIIVRGRGINGLREIELRGRLLTEALPLAMQANQAGKLPDETLDGALKSYFDSKGVNTSAMPSQASKREIQTAGLNPAQTSDGRTYNPAQSMTGVT
jgi:hypothetical protein